MNDQHEKLSTLLVIREYFVVGVYTETTTWVNNFEFSRKPEYL